MIALASRPLRVLVVDDSHVSRQLITDALGGGGTGEIVVVGHASNGERALRMVAELEPDAITLDLEMPKMDGFTFLRLLMARRAIPVVVLSSHGGSENVFRALELGAFDFVAKPDDLLSSHGTLSQELRAKLLAARDARPRPRTRQAAPASVEPRRPSNSPVPLRHVVGVAASTGGPAALLHIFSRLPANFPGTILIAQHMAPGFTRSFAERLSRTTPLTIHEAQEGDALTGASAFVAPGGACMTLHRDGNQLRLSIRPPGKDDRYVPNANALLSSIADVVGGRSIGVVLTGMADDGVAGAEAIQRAGGLVLAESEETAVVFGMPGAAVRAGVVTRVLPLPQLADWLAALA